MCGLSFLFVRSEVVFWDEVSLRLYMVVRGSTFFFLQTVVGGFCLDCGLYCFGLVLLVSVL